MMTRLEIVVGIEKVDDGLFWSVIRPPVVIGQGIAATPEIALARAYRALAEWADQRSQALARGQP